MTPGGRRRLVGSSGPLTYPSSVMGGGIMRQRQQQQYMAAHPYYDNDDDDMEQDEECYSREDEANDDDINGDLLPEPRWVCPDHSDVCSVTGVTLSRYMMEMARYNPELEEIESIFTSIQTASKTISSLVRHAFLTDLVGAEGTVNVQGEDQKKLDVICNDVLKRALKWTGKLGTVASEEEETPVAVLQDNRGKPVYSSNVLVEQEGGYVAVFDPLDGSSNIDAGIPVGTIFGIFANTDEEECAIDEDPDQVLSEEEKRCLTNTLQPGTNLVAAGYCLYSSATMLVFTLGSGVVGFTLDEMIGEFVMTHKNIRLPNRGKIYSINESNRWEWDEPMKKYISDIQQGRGDTKTKYSSRYVGSMVADVHRTLLHGGIFGYPADKKNPDGKLRLLYEAAPMSFLIEQAGGLALTGRTRIMDISPRTVHQRVPCILGSRDDVAELQRYYEASDDPELIARCEARRKGTSVSTTHLQVSFQTTASYIETDNDDDDDNVGHRK